MTLLQIKPMLATLEVRETVDFYVNILGFTGVNNSDDWSWACFRRDNIEIMATRPKAHLPFEKPLFTGSFYISTNNADAVWDEVKEKVSICYCI